MPTDGEIADAARTDRLAQRGVRQQMHVANLQARRAVLTEQLQGTAAGTDRAPLSRPRRQAAPLNRLIERG